MASFLDVCRFNPIAGGTTDWTYSTAVTGYQSPAAAGAVNGAIYRYRAESNDLSQWEVGYGAYNSTGSVFARTTVLFNSSGTTSKISFSAAPQVAIIALAEDLSYVITPQLYGGAGDNATDNVGPFQKAVNAISSAGGGTLAVPGGTYLFQTQAGSSPQITIPSNVCIKADPGVYYMVQGGAAAAGVHTYGTALFTNSGWSTGGSNTNIEIIGGKFKSTTATNCGGFLAFKNVNRLSIVDVKLLDIVGACRFQISYCMNVMLDNILVDYETPHAGPWGYEDGIRIGSGCFNVTGSKLIINSGDNAIAINNEPSESQDTITSITPFAYSTSGASIKNIYLSNLVLTTQQNQAILLYHEATRTIGSISNVTISGFYAKPVNPTATWGPGISSVGTLPFVNIVLDDFTMDGSSLGTSGAGSPSAISFSPYTQLCTLSNFFLTGVTAAYGILCGYQQTISNGYISGCTVDQYYTNVAYTKIIGCTSDTAARYGINLDAGAVHATIMGNKIIGSVGAAINENASALLNTVIGNNVSGSGAIATASPSSIYANNIGANPGGTAAPVTMGTSPFTVTAGPSAETHYVKQSATNTGFIIKGGQGIHNLVGATTFYIVELGPHESYATTWTTTAPTYIRDIH